ncbi:hypothetical protein OCA8868_03105 [Octadecabacter ascidiaceicola]|uniref:Uncharacterized protein n=1 Tax=Octadecabacter ascidiaceicola TaxID=1655543 RepID=A0A238KNR8_9RHOB|nr:hypothetical protein OCA8868_03105 [Octadecabacter ascidiaceicola]
MIEVKVSIFLMPDVFPCEFVKLGEFMERHRRIGMVFNVIGHVPRKEPHKPVHERRAGALKHGSRVRATRMFRK